MPPGPCTLLKQPVCIETPSPFLQHLIGLHSNALPDAGPLKGSEVTRIKLQTQAQAGGKGQAGRDRHRQTQAGTGNKRQAGTDSQISSGGSPNTPQLTDRHRHRHRTSDCVRSPTCRSPPPQSFGTPPPSTPPPLCESKVSTPSWFTHQLPVQLHVECPQHTSIQQWVIWHLITVLHCCPHLTSHVQRLFCLSTWWLWVRKQENRKLFLVCRQEVLCSGRTKQRLRCCMMCSAFSASAPVGWGRWLGEEANVCVFGGGVLHVGVLSSTCRECTLLHSLHA